MKKFRAISIVLALPPLFLFTAHSQISVGTADFLKIGVGARAEGLGSAYTALGGDATSMYWNPAGLAQVKKRELALMHAPWLLNTQFDFLGVAQPFSFGTLGLGITRLAAGGLEGRGPNREPLGDFSTQDMAYAVSFGHPIGLGATLKVLHSRIGSDSASTWALDAGVSRKFEHGPVVLGASVRNLGPGLRFISQRDSLPLLLSVGASYAFSSSLLAVADLRHEPYARTLSFALGTEYSLLSILSLRAGYTPQLSSLAGLGAGIGFKLGRLRADYAFTPFEKLGSIQRFSLSTRF